MIYAEKAGARITPLLDAGEQLLAAARFQVKGASNGAGGVVGVAVQQARSSGSRKAARGAGIDLPQRGVVVATDHRIVILSTTAFLGRPKAIRTEIPIGNLAGAALEGHALAPALKRMRLTFTTGGAADIDLFKRDGTDEIVAAINGRLGR